MPPDVYLLLAIVDCMSGVEGLTYPVFERWQCHASIPGLLLLLGKRFVDNLLFLRTSHTHTCALLVRVAAGRTFAVKVCGSPALGMLLLLWFADIVLH